MTKIPDAIGEVAVAWGDACHLSVEDKVKLAQDILEATDKHLSELSKQQSIEFWKYCLHRGYQLTLAANAIYDAFIKNQSL